MIDECGVLICRSAPQQPEFISQQSYLPPFLLASLLVVSCHNAGLSCDAFARDSVWAFVMSSDIGERMEGEIRIVDSARRIVGARTTPDGALMPLDEVVENFWMDADSFRFVFSRDDYVVRGQCLDEHRAAVIYAAPLIERGRPVSGRGMMTGSRTRNGGR